MPRSSVARRFRTASKYGYENGVCSVFSGSHAAEQQVHVAVDEPGQHGRAGAVDDLVAVQPGADVDDPAVLHHDVRAGRGRPGAVEDLTVREEGAHGTESHHG